ncbi:MAG: AMP-binding protein [Candidatus Hodarchaeales archaeon]
MKTAKGKITTKKSGNRGYKSAWIYIPSKVYKDGLFPFQDDEEVIIEIEEDSLVISKNNERSNILRDFGIDNATIPRLLEIKASENKNKPYLLFKDESYSYREVNYASNELANGILTLINELDLIKPKISLLMKNCPEYLFTWFGIAKAGCIFVPINTLLKSDIKRYILNNSDTEILILDYEFLHDLGNIRENFPKIKKVLIRNAPPDFEFGDIFQEYQSIKTSSFENPKIRIYHDDPIEILYSYGSTGIPKGVVYRNLVLAGVAIGYELNQIGLNDVEKIYCPIPLSHGVSHIFTVIPSLFYNKCLVINEEFNPVSFWEDIRLHQVNCFFYFRDNLTKLLYQKATIRDRVHSLKFAYGFGTELDLWSAIEKRFGILLHDCWSHIEGIGITINKVGSKGGKIGSIGKPLDFLELKIVNSKGTQLPPGPNNIGEIVVRRKSGAVFEYYKRPTEEDVRVDDDKWIFTGDFGYKDYDGYVYFKGKRMEIIHKGKDTIFSGDIERVVNSHPNIIKSALIPLNYENNDNIELKIIVVKVENSPLTHAELCDFLYHNLAYFHVPRFIEIREESPKGPSIELFKKVLLEEWENGESRKSTWDSQIYDFLKE